MTRREQAMIEQRIAAQASALARHAYTATKFERAIAFQLDAADAARHARNLTDRRPAARFAHPPKPVLPPRPLDLPPVLRSEPIVRAKRRPSARYLAPLVALFAMLAVACAADVPAENTDDVPPGWRVAPAGGDPIVPTYDVELTYPLYPSTRADVCDAFFEYPSLTLRQGTQEVDGVKSARLTVSQHYADHGIVILRLLDGSACDFGAHVTRVES